MSNGYFGKIDSTYNEKAVANAIRKITSVYNTYIKDTKAKTYLAIIPDKNYFLAEEYGAPMLDYEKLYGDTRAGLPMMEYIEIKEQLSIEDYYRNDMHWRQEKILDVAQRISKTMGVTLNKTYSQVKLTNPLNSTYYGVLPDYVKNEFMAYLNASYLDKCKAYDHENKKSIPIYDVALAGGEISYDMFLSGALSVIALENPKAETDKELVIFRDSFGSSIAPLFLEGYKKITLLDIRYLNENMVRQFVTFDNQDVLFLYSTTVLNNRSSFR